MRTYVVLQVATDYGAGSMLASSEEGAKLQEAAIHRLGGNLLAQYATLGRYSVVLIVELPDDEAAIALSLQSAQEGFETELLPAFAPSAVTGALARLVEAFAQPHTESSEA